VFALDEEPVLSTGSTGRLNKLQYSVVHVFVVNDSRTYCCRSEPNGLTLLPKFYSGISYSPSSSDSCSSQRLQRIRGLLQPLHLAKVPRYHLLIFALLVPQMEHPDPAPAADVATDEPFPWLRVSSTSSPVLRGTGSKKDVDNRNRRFVCWPTSAAGAGSGCSI